MTARHLATHPLARLLPAVDLVLLAAAFSGAYLVRFGELPLRGGLAHVAAHLAMGLALLAGWLPALFLLDLYQPARFAAPLRLLGRVVQAGVLVALAGAALLFLLQAKLASRAVFAATVAGAVLPVWGVRVLLGRLLARRADGLRVLVLGAGPEAARLAATLRPAEIVGFLGDEDGVASPRLGALGALPAVLDAEVIDHVVVALPPEAWGDVEAALATCVEVGVDVSVAAPLSEAVLARAAPDRLFGHPVLRFDGSPQFRAAMLGKRAFDLVAALALLPLALPVVAVAALLVRLTSRGPALFVQERVGLNGRRFRLYKLRTMENGARRLPPPSGTSDPVFKPEADPRVTRVGRVLRRFSIDELPQLWNVVKGDMSLVGPRPPLPEEVERYDRWQRRRLSMRPGLTCLWQVSGRSELGFDEWMRLDLAYIDNWSPWLDLQILLRTLPAVVGGKGAR